MALPVVAVVGRPNVGKSTLFNKLIGQRLSIVEDTPGVTRDRIYAKGEWRNRSFMLVDTGGIETVTDDVILKQMRRQAELAIERADVIVLVTDVRCGVTADDSAPAGGFLRSRPARSRAAPHWHGKAAFPAFSGSGRCCGEIRLRPFPAAATSLPVLPPPAAWDFPEPWQLSPVRHRPAGLPVWKAGRLRAYSGFR